MRLLRFGLAALAASCMLAGCGIMPKHTVHVRVSNHRTTADRLLSQPPKHVVIVVEENHSYSDIVANAAAPYINALMADGATLTNYHAVEHPSEPNYLDLFSGSNQGLTSDACPNTFSTPNLASELAAAHLTFKGYSEDLPSVGYTGCTYANFARKHSPWINFTNIPATDNVPFSQFPHDFSKLPTVSFVIPNLQHDMHNGTVAAGDTWLKQNIEPYAAWAKTHDSLLIVTWDEDDGSAVNHIPTLLVGPMIQPGTYNEDGNHFSLLRTLEDLYSLPYIGQAASAKPMTGLWTTKQS